MKKDINVLIVEDETLVSDMIRGTLKEINYNVVGRAVNGYQAVEMTQKLNPDVILMDIKLPDISGIDATKMIYEKRPTPIVMLSAYYNQELLESASESGAGGYLIKPASHSEMERTITITIDRFQETMKLKKLNEDKDKFFSIISHDIKNPLFSMNGYLGIMTEYIDKFSKEKIKDMTLNLKKTYESFERLIDNLLSWSRMQTGMLKSIPKTINLYDIAIKNIKLFQQNAEQKEILIQNEIENKIEAYADYNMVDTIFRNLISNSIKFTNKGGTVKISALLNKNDIIISIYDNGIGISEKNLKILFKIDSKCTQTGTSGEKGTGLGLILCKEFVERNGGRIWCETELGKGTTFYFNLKSGNN
ncbi:MAG: hybrid sensor histidine kinase/response regulator [Desulfobacterales bacterium]|nr:hybrid sensor histidine kinase/response regulator [Desulfobacterales bacterium]